MEELRKAVVELAGQELARANAKFPPFHSLHEGYAVLLEELEETTEAVNECVTQSGVLWQHTKANEFDYAMKTTEHCREAALNAACEAIQRAAMCQKLLALRSPVSKPSTAPKKKPKEQTAEEKALDEACLWITKNGPAKKWPCGPDGDEATTEKCRQCLKLHQDATKGTEANP